MEKMNELVSVDTRNLTVDAHSHIPMKKLQMSLSDYDLTYNFVSNLNEEINFLEFVKDITLSESSIFYGKPRASVLSTEVVFPDGKIVSFNAPLPCGGTGQNLARFFIFLHGIVCIVTSFKIKVWKQPVSSRIIAGSFESLKSAVNCARKVIHSGIRPSVSRIYVEGWRKEGSEQEAEDAKNFIVFGVDGEQAITDAIVFWIERFIVEGGGIIARGRHFLATKTLRPPSGYELTPNDLDVICSICDWEAVLNIVADVQQKLEEHIVATKISDFFPEGCKISWYYKKEGIEEDFQKKLSSLVLKSGGEIISRGKPLAPFYNLSSYFGSPSTKILKKIKRNIDKNDILI